jgi:hypothetical protein
MGWARSTKESEKNAHMVFVEKLEQEQTERPTHRWKDNFKVDLKVLNWSVWIEFIWPWRGTLAFRIIIHYG